MEPVNFEIRTCFQRTRLLTRISILHFQTHDKSSRFLIVNTTTNTRIPLPQTQTSDSGPVTDRPPTLMSPAKKRKPEEIDKGLAVYPEIPDSAPGEKLDETAEVIKGKFPSVKTLRFSESKWRNPIQTGSVFPVAHIKQLFEDQLRKYKELEKDGKKSKNDLLLMYWNPFMSKCILKDRGIWHNIKPEHVADVQRYYDAAILADTDYDWRHLDDNVRIFVNSIRNVRLSTVLFG